MNEEERHDSYCGVRLLSQIDRFRVNCSGVIAGEEDSEYLHKARVALRRMRVILSLMTHVFSKRDRKKWNVKLRDLGRVLGKARDLDVKCIFLENMDKELQGYGTQRLLLRLRQQRIQMKPELTDALNCLKKAALEEKITKIMRPLLGTCAMEVKEASPLPESRQVMITALKRVAGHDAFVKNSYEREAYHSLRKDCKKLRYVLEIYSDSFDAVYGDFLSNIKKLQDLLGDIHDDDLWLEMLPCFIEEERLRTEEYFGHSRGFVKISRNIEGLMTILDDRFSLNKEKFLSSWKELFDSSSWQFLLDQIDEKLEGDGIDGAS